MGDIRFMKYKSGDKVRIKENLPLILKKRMIDSHLVNTGKTIDMSFFYKIEEEVRKLNTNRFVTIKEINGGDYKMKEIRWNWKEEEFERDKESIPILTRWEILDL